MWLARHHAGDRIALGHAVGIHDPGHGLRVGINIGRRNVLLRPDQRQNGAGIAAGHALQFTLRHVLGIAGDSALAAAEGNVHHGAFPCHPRGQRLHFVQGDLGVIADAAFGRPARRAVLHAIAFKAANVPVVHAHRHAYREYAFRILDHHPDVVCRGLWHRLPRRSSPARVHRRFPSLLRLASSFLLGCGPGRTRVYGRTSSPTRHELQRAKPVPASPAPDKPGSASCGKPRDARGWRQSTTGPACG